MPNGEIQEEHINSLEKIGKWVSINGETIYGTRKGPINPTDELVSTRKENKIFLHLLNFEENELVINNLKEKIKKVYILQFKFKSRFINSKNLFLQLIWMKRQLERDRYYYRNNNKKLS